METKYYDTNRKGKSYPVLELDVVELFDKYMDSLDEYDVEQFIEKWLGHKKFLELAHKYLVEAYSSNNYDTDTSQARAALLEALEGNRVGNAADAVATSARQKWYYEGLYWQMYHGLSRFMDGMDTETHQRWNAFFRQYKEENPAPEIGSKAWAEYGNKTHTEVMELVKNALAA